MAKKIMRHTWILFFVAFVVVPFAAESCQCEPLSPEKEYETSSAIFAGRVIEVGSEKHGQIRVEFELVRNWKGETKEKIEIITPEKSEDCGFHFVSGETYLVYTTGKPPLLVTVCSRTKPISEAEKEEENLELIIQSEKARSRILRRDPFVTVKGDKPVVGKRQLRPPEALKITHIVIVGITRKGEEYIALLRGTDGRVYFKKTGDSLYDGKILKIERNTVTFGQEAGSGMKVVKKKLHPFE